MHGDFSIREIDLSRVKLLSLFILKPTVIESINLQNYKGSLSFVPLCKDVHTINLAGGTFTDLSALIECKNLMSLDLSNVKINQAILDNYLIALAANHLGRRSCTVIFTGTPSGIYTEPAKDQNMNYIISSGMEAIWVIVNEPAWNEGSYWKFNINDTIYTSEE